MHKLETKENRLILGTFIATSSHQQLWVSLWGPEIPLTAKWGENPTVPTASDLRSNNLKT